MLAGHSRGGGYPKANRDTSGPRSISQPLLAPNTIALPRSPALLRAPIARIGRLPLLRLPIARSRRPRRRLPLGASLVTGLAQSRSLRCHCAGSKASFPKCIRIHFASWAVHRLAQSPEMILRETRRRAPPGALGVGLGTVQRARKTTDPNGSVETRLGRDGRRRKAKRHYPSAPPSPSSPPTSVISCLDAALTSFKRRPRSTAPSATFRNGFVPIRYGHSAQ